jgi:hypothetical protein
VKNSEQSGLQLVLRIYALHRAGSMPQNGASLWILVEKKAFLQSRAQREIPTVASIQTRM